MMLKSSHCAEGQRRVAPGTQLGRQRGVSSKRKVAQLKPVAVAAPIVQSQAPYRVTDDTIRDVQSLFQSQLSEFDYAVQDAWVEGEIPKELTGTYFRNGPGLQVNSGRYKRHTFDGDGCILSFAFEGGKCHFRNRFVRTQSFVEEQEAGRPLYRGAFTRGSADGSLLFNPFDFTLKNAANTGVLHWGGKLLAMYESGLPHELDPVTLDTLGPCTLGAQLETPVLAAHYRVERQPDGSRRWVAFSTNAGPGGVKLVFYEFGEDGKALSTTSTRLEGVPIAMVHDMAITANYYVVPVGPLAFNAGRFVSQYMLSRCSIAECLEYQEGQPTRVQLIPRPGGAAAGQPVRIIDAPCGFSFHHANAYELEHEGRPHLVLDSAVWQRISFDANQFTLRPDYYQGGNRSHLERLVFDLSSDTCVGRHQLMTRTMEFPSPNWDYSGKPHTHVYCSGDVVDDPKYWGPSQAVVKVSANPRAGLRGSFDASEEVALDVWAPGARCIVNEPLFVPSPGATEEDDGWVLVTVHDAATQKGDLVILDARQPSKGPLATIHCPHFLPAGLHGSFSSQVFGATSEAAPAWKEPHTWRAL